MAGSIGADGCWNAWKASMTDVFAEARAIWKRYVDIEFTTDDRQSDAGFDEQLTLDLQRQPLRRNPRQQASRELTLRSC